MKVGLLVLVFSFLNISILNAQEMCLPYTQDKTIVASLNQADDKTVSQVNTLFNRYMKLAKINDYKTILQLHTRIDNSYKDVDQRLKESPDVYASYSGIKKVDTGKLFEWGNYRLMMSEYFHTDGRAFLSDAFYCSSSCQLSTLFDNPDEQTFLVSRFIYKYERMKTQPIACNINGGSFFNIFPKINVSNKKSLKIYVNKNLEQDKINFLDENNLQSLPVNIASCYEKIVDADENEALNESFASEIIKQCSLNMAVDKLIPVLSIENKIEARFLTAVAYVSLIRNLATLTPVLRFNDGAKKVIVTVADSVSSCKYLVVMPIVEKNGKAFFDWDYFGTAAGEIMVSTYFGHYIKNKI